MGELTIVCPATGKYVRIGIVMDAATFERSEFDNNRIPCPYCDEVHVWGKKDVHFLEELREQE
jgi:hypothetical protein